MPFLDVGVGEMWGVWRDALPRISFQTVLPYLLTLVVLWRNQPRRWPWLMILAGLMVFLHSVSTPAWGLAIWLGLWLYHPAGWKWPKRLGVMFGLGLLFLLALSPFALNFFSYQAARRLAGLRPGHDSDPDLPARKPAQHPGRLWPVPAGRHPLAAYCRWPCWAGSSSGALAAPTAAWWAWCCCGLAGIFLAAIVLPFGERLVEQALRIPPIDTELVRGMRYFVPLMLLFWLWPLVELAPRLADARAVRAVMLVGILLLGGWTATHTPEGRKMVEALNCLAHRQLVCSGPRAQADFITALRTQTPEGARIFNFNQDDKNTSNALSIRYDALRPLVYTVRDAGLFIYANRAAFKDWLAITRQVDAIQLLEDPAEKLKPPGAPGAGPAGRLPLARLPPQRGRPQRLPGGPDLAKQRLHHLKLRRP